MTALLELAGAIDRLLPDDELAAFVWLLAYVALVLALGAVALDELDRLVRRFRR